MKIGELAQVAHCTVETVRYYEKEGLLAKPGRTSGNFRVYGPEHLERLCFIRNCRALDMSHGEIHALLGLVDHPGENCAGINAVFEAHMVHVDQRMQELSQLKQQLATLRQRCQSQQSVAACGILQGLATMATMATAAATSRQTHLG